MKKSLKKVQFFLLKSKYFSVINNLAFSISSVEVLYRELIDFQRSLLSPFRMLQNETFHELPGNSFHAKSWSVYVGGNFTTVGGQPINGIAALDSSGVATSWNPNASNAVYSLAISGSTIYTGGNFTSIGGKSRNRIAALDSSGSATSWNPNTNGTINTIVTIGSNIYVGGSFTSVGLSSRGGFFKIDPANNFID